ncbi:Cold shock-induced protein TIR1, partial [Nakaseomyces glabratus]
MAYSKTAILIAAAAALVSAQTPQQLDELNVILDDVKSNLSSYMSLVQDPSSGITLANLPAGVLNLGMALASATDDSYTTLYKDIDFDGIVPFLSKLPWYSERLAGKLAKDLGEASSSAAPSSSA